MDNLNAEKILIAHQYFIENESQIKAQNKNDEGDCLLEKYSLLQNFFAKKSCANLSIKSVVGIVNA